MTAARPRHEVISTPPARTVAVHLRAVLAAMGMAVALLVAVRVALHQQLHGRLEAFAGSAPTLKMNGNLLQTGAFAEPGVLPVYGSSELDQPAGNRPDRFFRRRRTGFNVFLAGHAGTTCLMILQKIAAAGGAAHGKKAVVFLSPAWFARPEVAPRTVTANLPTAQLSAWIFDSPLRLGVKEQIARRLLDYPEATKGQPLLEEAVRSLAQPDWAHRWLFAGLWPLGKCQNELSRGLEAGTLLWKLCRHPRRFERVARDTAPLTKGRQPGQDLPWLRLADRAEARDRARGDGTVFSATTRDAGAGRREVRIHPQPPGSRDAEFAAKLDAAEEWGDLKLLTEVLKDLGVRAMFVSQPFNGKYYDLSGTTRGGRQLYYDKLAAVVRPSGFAVRDYSKHEEDRFFFNDSGHPSAKAWIYYDQALDQFYHGSAH